MDDKWQANRSYSAGTLIRPTTDNYRLYKAIQAGISGSTEPTWPTQLLQTVTDGTVIWICLSKMICDPVFDKGFDYAKEATHLTVCSTLPTHYVQACDCNEWQAETSYQVGMLVRPAVARNGFVYQCIQAGTSGSQEPAWSTQDEATVEDGTVTWKAHANFSLCRASLDSTDLSVLTGSKGGKKIRVAEKTNILVYRSGVGRCAVLLKEDTQELLLITTPFYPQNFEAGGMAKITAFESEINQPGE